MVPGGPPGGPPPGFPAGGPPPGFPPGGLPPGFVMPKMPLKVRLRILWYAFRFKLESSLRRRGLLPKQATADAAARGPSAIWTVLPFVLAVVVGGALGLGWWLAAPAFVHYAIDRPSPLGEGAELLAEGTFTGQGGHSGQGKALLGRTAEGTAVLRLESFEVTNGPDLRVWLSRDAAPANDAQVRNGYELGPLRAPAGNFHYTLPASADLDAVKSVVIYCEPFRVIFSVAPLE